MSTMIITVGELFGAAIAAAREMSEKILKLADLNVSPLAPGETADTRRHQIAGLGKKLAEAFLVVDDLVRSFHDSHKEPNDVTAAPATMVDNPEAN